MLLNVKNTARPAVRSMAEFKIFFWVFLVFLRWKFWGFEVAPQILFFVQKF